jgi:uncharacterized repeat protein (TIGR03843 family)
MSNNRIQTQSIDDILDNIRSAINKPVSKQLVSDNYGGYDLLELTDVVQDDGTILQVKKDNNISNHQEIKLSNKILSDTVTSEKLLSDEVIVESSKYISDFVDQLLHAKLFNEQESTAQLRKLALFDAIINNTDRKFGHLLVDINGALKGCDHGVAFHSEDKLRTVLWQFADDEFSTDEIDLLTNVKNLDLDVFREYLTQDEIGALSRRIQQLSVSGRFPEPSQSWPAVPWPPV